MTKIKKVKNPTTFEGLPLYDAAEDIGLVINKKDVSESKKKDPANCAAALAGRREFKADVRVYMSRMYVKDEKNKRWIRFVTPESASREITAFDRGASFEPGEYRFTAPSRGQQLGYQREKGSSNIVNKKIRKKIAHHRTANVRISAKDKVK